jgi:hypothetical protein
VPAPLLNPDSSADDGRLRSNALAIARPSYARRRYIGAPLLTPCHFVPPCSRAAKGKIPSLPTTRFYKPPVGFARDGGDQHAGGKAESPSLSRLVSRLDLIRGLC